MNGDEWIAPGYYSFQILSPFVLIHVMHLVASVGLFVCLFACTLQFEPFDLRLDFWYGGRP